MEVYVSNWRAKDGEAKTAFKKCSYFTHNPWYFFNLIQREHVITPMGDCDSGELKTGKKMSDDRITYRQVGRGKKSRMTA